MSATFLKFFGVNILIITTILSEMFLIHSKLNSK
nr:MAG TPA: hypothetical protein [Caudoviricetes sp.]